MLGDIGEDGLVPLCGRWRLRGFYFLTDFTSFSADFVKHFFFLKRYIYLKIYILDLIDW